MNSTDARKRLLRACYSVMVPIARFLLRSGVGFKEFADVSRMAFVDVASRDYGLRGRPTNISRVAAMTGIGRKEVSRLRSVPVRHDHGVRAELGPLSDVLQRWHTDEAYLDRQGLPRPLPMRAFERLVRVCAGDIPSGAIKVELIRCGSVREDKKGRLCALRRGVVPADLDEKLITAMVFGLRGLASTIAFNTSVNELGPKGRIERFCLSDEMTEECIRAMHPVLRERIQAFADQMTDLIAQPLPATGGRRIGVGIYYYEDDQPEDSSFEPPKGGPRHPSGS
jgi:hypothetical protein